MGFNFDTTAATAILKNRYTEKKIETLSYISPLWGMMPKDTMQGGQQYIGAVRYQTATSVSPVDSTAFSAGNASTYAQWQIPYVDLFGSANITGGAIDRSKGDVNALVDSLVGEFDGIFISLGLAYGRELFSNGGGSIGQISSGSSVGTATITLSNPSEIVNFQKNQVLQLSSDDGTGGAGVRAGTVTVLSVDRSLGTITATGNWTAGIAAAAAGDFIFANGFYNSVITGLAGWLPAPAWTTPGGTAIASKRPAGGDSFFGVNRNNTDPIRLAGQYYSGNGAPKEESLIQLAMLIGLEGGRPDTVVMNPRDYADIVKALESRVQYVTKEAFENPQIGFKGFELATAFGTLTCLADPFCPQGLGYMLQLNTWLIVSMGKMPKIISSPDGLDWLRNPTNDSYQLRAVGRGNTYCSAPGYNGVVAF